MPKYIKVFPTHADYELWTASEDYVIPSVGYCINTVNHSEIHYNPTVHIFESVDLGLPSGTLWAACNMGAADDSSTDPGSVYAWGETEGVYWENVGTGRNFWYSNYKWWDFDNDEPSKYSENDEKTVLDPEDDIATAVMGSNWHIPYFGQVRELMLNTTLEYSPEPKGMILTSKINGNEIFFPMPGYFRCLYEPNPDSWETEADWTEGSYWINSLESQGRSESYGVCSCILDVYYETDSGQEYIGDNIYNNRRPCGNLIKAATVPDYEYVDLGLPSGALWATRNLGADSSSTSGAYFSWGYMYGFTEEEAIKDSSEGNGRIPFYNQDNYVWYENKYTNPTDTFYDLDDPAMAWWGPNWCTPTMEMFRELVENCDLSESTPDYIELESNNNGNKIRFANAGKMYAEEINDNLHDAVTLYNTVSKSETAYCSLNALDSDNNNYNNCMVFGNGLLSVPRYEGYNIRPVKRAGFFQYRKRIRIFTRETQEIISANPDAIPPGTDLGWNSKGGSIDIPNLHIGNLILYNTDTVYNINFHEADNMSEISERGTTDASISVNSMILAPCMADNEIIDYARVIWSRGGWPQK